MPGKVTLIGSARKEFVRGDRTIDDPKMHSRVFKPSSVPRGIGRKPPSQVRGEFRRSVKPSKAGGSRIRHVEMKVRFIQTGRENHHMWSQKVTGYMNYLTRKGVGIDEEKPEFFKSASDGGVEKAERRDFFMNVRGDMFVMEIIIPPNDGEKVKDMEGLTAAIMSKIENDLGTKLDWIAVVHEKKDISHEKNRHAHVLVRGVDDEGHELRISAPYITSTLRDVAQQEISAYPTNEREQGWRLGPMSETEAKEFREQLARNLPHRERRYGKNLGTENEQQHEQQKQRARDHSRGMEE